MKNIHLLPTDKPSRLLLSKRGNLQFLKDNSSTNFNNHFIGTYQNIYITSDEEIKVGDWFIHPDSSCFDKECKEVSIGGYEILRVIKVDENFIYHSAMMVIHKNKNIKKIILTDDPDLIAEGVQPIDNDFLEWFVKNPSCERVEVEIIEVEDYVGFAGHTSYPTFHNEYKIIIPKEGTFINS
jgi:hypothetical protein